MQGLWWAKQHCFQFFSKYLGFPYTFHSTNCSIFISHPTIELYRILGSQSGDYKAFSLMEYNVVNDDRRFRGTVLQLLHASFLPGSSSDPEERGDILSRNVRQLSTDYTALYPRRRNSSFACHIVPLSKA